MHRYPIVSITVPLLAALACAQAAAPGEAAFDEGLAAVQALMQKAKWGDARAALLQLLGAHERQVYVQAQRDRVVEDMRACCFYAQAKVPRVEDLVTGKLLAWTPATGRIKLEYDVADVRDWKPEGDVLVHPLVFAGSYSVTLAGERYPSPEDSLCVFFDCDPGGDTYYFADFGFALQAYQNSTLELPARVGVARGEEFDTLERGKSLAKPAEKFVATVKVGQGQVELVFGRKTMLRAKRPKADYGQVAVLPRSFDTCVLEGTIEPSWLQSRVDEELDAQRAQFDQAFRAEKELPAWLFARPAVTRTPPLATSWLPGAEAGVSAALEAVLQLWRDGKLDEADAALAQLGDGDAPAASRAFLLAELLLQRGRPEAAEPCCAQVLAAHPASSHARAQKARVATALGRSAEALAELQQALAADPGEAALYADLCVALMRRGRLAEAMRLLRDAKVRHGLWDEVQQLEQMLAMSQRGPSWPRRYVHRSTHYEVASDIDAKVCARAATVLEESYVNLMAQLAWIKEDKTLPRFRVFLFSGEAGYQQYVKAIRGSTAPHTAGVYSPVLKQLLIWNLPEREDMERTIRHEGLHQFVDRLMADPPTWFNEGLAEFWERAQRANGRLQGGQPRPEHVAMLVRSRASLPKLKQLAYGNGEDFYANAQLRYAQAWAFVHFLRKGPPAHAARFQVLWEQLRTAASARAALDAAFAGADWDRLEQDFWTHVLGQKG